MPWTPEQFRKKHNKKLSLSQAGKAARQAEAMMRNGVSEGIAIATANKGVMRSKHTAPAKAAKGKRWI